MLNGVMLLWFLLTAMALAFVAIDVRSMPMSRVMKWGFVLLTAYTGPIGAFLYVLGCREPLPGLHERYIAARWRQVLGSTMHCVAGDGVGILAGAIVASYLTCGPAPAAPVTVAFVLAGGIGRVVALPVSATDTFGVPPCLGAPGSAGNIEMHPWAP